MIKSHDWPASTLVYAKIIVKERKKQRELTEQLRKAFAPNTFPPKPKEINDNATG